MKIDLDKEEWEYLETSLIKAVAIARMNDSEFLESQSKKDAKMAVRLLQRFIRERDENIE